MLRQTTNLITLAAFLFYSFASSGCTSRVSVPVRELKLDPPKKVTRVKLEQDSTLVWNSQGAAYIYQAEMFEGITTDGVRQHVRLGSIDSIYYTLGDSPSEQSLDAGAFHKDETNRRKDPIRGKIEGYFAGIGLTKFQKTGWIDTLNQSIVGIIDTGDTLRTPLNEVASLSVRRASPTKTLLLTAGITVAIFALWAAIAMSQFELNWRSTSMGN
ncbi:MAG: hypothetical protein JSV52_06655 [Candidatus Zixiibacteriota bacterium]|nr:MAG: hypothetical protein JSV52_06655 [candidate division Zixibacteria bacterium]